MMLLKCRQYKAAWWRFLQSYFICLPVPFGLVVGITASRPTGEQAMEPCLLVFALFLSSGITQKFSNLAALNSQSVITSCFKLAQSFNPTACLQWVPHMTLTAQSGYFQKISCPLIYLPVHFHFTRGVMYTGVDLDQPAPAVLSKLEL